GGAGVARDVGHPTLDLLGRDGLAVGLPYGELPPHEVYQRVKDHGFPERQAVTLVPVGLVADTPPELEQQAGFADARVPDEEGGLPVAGPGALEGVEQRDQLTLAPHERREAAVGPYLQARACLPGRYDFPDGERLGLALELDLAQRSRLEIAVNESVRRLGDRYAPRLAHLLQPRR